MLPDFICDPGRFQANFPQLAAKGIELSDEVKARRTGKFLIPQNYRPVIRGGNAGNLDQFGDAGAKTRSGNNSVHAQYHFLCLISILGFNGMKSVYALSADFPDRTDDADASCADIPHKGMIENGHHLGPGKLLGYSG